MSESLFIETGTLRRPSKIKSTKGRDKGMVQELKRVSKTTVRKIENAYAVLVMVCTSAAIVKLATQPKVHSTLGALPIWQVVAGILAAGLLYTVFHLIDDKE